MKLPRDDDKFDDDGENEAFVVNSKVVDDEPPTIPNPIIDCCVSCFASIQFLWLFRRAEFLLAIALFVCLGIAVFGVIETHQSKKHSFKYHQFKHVYEDVQSPLELKLGEIDHWCLDGTDDNCPQCDDPTQPISRGEYNGWKQAFLRNVKMSTEDYVKQLKDPDIIFLGDSLVEATVGTFKGLQGLQNTPAANELDNIKQLYDKKFSKANGGKYDALRLGIAGDTSPNVFWRLKQNEMRNLSPQIWWVAVGRNDMFRTKCSEEVALMGVIRVVEEIINRNDGATIVINSILPTSPKSTLQVEGHWFPNEMYKSIEEVNKRLKKFAMKHHHVVFYDANEIFIEQRGKSKYITKKMYVDKVHPSFAGYKALANAQLSYIDTLMEKRKNAGEYPKTPQSSTSSTSSTDKSIEAKKERYVDAAQDAEGGEYLEYDDYYNYESLFEDEDDFLNDLNIYGDDLQFDDW